MNAESAWRLIVGIGNLYRRDDAVGIAIVRRLRPRVPADVRVVEETGEGTRLVEVWRGASSVILIDAVQSGAPPGTIHRLDARTQQIPAEWFRCSSHAFSLAQAIELGRALDQLPQRVVLYGIEGLNFEAGEALSRPVEMAIDAVVSQVLGEIGGQISTR
ncbi:MAG TPA: hydrogenase maturation protease [Candidatus Cybelea sp.]|nr:hydrogenase maturation protease [Candidatus Cybelea sp.]